MMLVRATVFLLLALVGSVMLTQAMATSDYEAPVEAMQWSNTAAVPNCQANYATMDPRLPKSLIQQPGSLTIPHAPCVNPINGDFLVTYWQPRTFIYLFDSCGWIKKKIELPSTARSHSCGCAFLGSKLFYAATINKKILQFTSEGVYEKVFATGYKFIYMTTRGSWLYTSIWPTKAVRVYDTTNGNLVTHFETTSGDTRQLAFDPQGYLHVATWGKTVEIFTHNGHKVHQITYPQVRIADGITIDNETYTILVDRGSKQVQVYNHNSLLVNRITGFNNPTGVAMGYKCGYLLVADYGRGIYML